MAEIPDTVDEALDDLSSPTTSEVLLATIDFPVRDIAVEAAKRSTEGGGGGGGSGLPTGWTQDGEDPANVETNGDVGEDTGTLSLGGVFLSAGEVSTPFVTLPGDGGSPAPARFLTPDPSMPSAEFRGAGQSPALAIFAAAEPDDGDIETGECGLWFDQTNGAPALMLKAKSLDGSVVVGSIPLPGVAAGLPDWWTVDSTPGAEKVSFAGDVRIEPTTDNDDPLIVKDHNGDAILSAYLTGSGQTVEIQGRDPDSRVLDVDASGGQAANIVRITGDGSGPDGLVSVGPTGAVAVTPSANDVIPLSVETQVAGQTAPLLSLVNNEDGGQLIVNALGSTDIDGRDVGLPALTVRASNDSSGILTLRDLGGTVVGEVGPTGAVTISPGDTADVLLTGAHAGGTADFSTLLALKASDQTAEVVYADTAGNLGVKIGEDTAGLTVGVDIPATPDFFQARRVADVGNLKLGEDDSLVGFFGAAAVAQPAAPSDAQGISDALAELGLLEAGGSIGGGVDLPGVVSPIPPQLFGRTDALGVSNYAFGARVVIPRSGTLTDLAIAVLGAAGNISVGVYSADATRARLYTTGSIAAPAAGAWRIVGDLELAVEAGEQYDLAFSADDGGMAVASQGAEASLLLPDEYTLGVAALPKLSWYKSASHPLPASFDEADLSVGGVTFAVIARVE